VYLHHSKVLRRKPHAGKSESVISVSWQRRPVSPTRAHAEMQAHVHRPARQSPCPTPRLKKEIGQVPDIGFSDMRQFSIPRGRFLYSSFPQTQDLKKLFHQVPLRGGGNVHIYSAPVRTRYDCFDRSGLVVVSLFGAVRPDRSVVFWKEKQNQPKQTSILNFRPPLTYFEEEAATYTTSIIHQWKTLVKPEF
jgi:hypothetical protein